MSPSCSSCARRWIDCSVSTYSYFLLLFLLTSCVCPGSTAKGSSCVYKDLKYPRGSRKRNYFTFAELCMDVESNGCIILHLDQCNVSTLLLQNVQPSSLFLIIGPFMVRMMNCRFELQFNEVYWVWIFTWQPWKQVAVKQWTTRETTLRAFQ